MKFQIRSTSRRAPGCQWLVLLALSPLSAAVMCAPGTTKIDRVSLVIRDGTEQRTSSGTLYRVFRQRRQFAAEVDQKGQLTSTVKCRRDDRFEALAASSLDRPIAPIQLPCAASMKFEFARAFITTMPTDLLSPIGPPTSAPAVYAAYGAAFEKVGDAKAAQAWKEASMYAVAKQLGDVKLDKFVFRDPQNEFKLSFTEEWTNVLRSRQVELGVPATGTLDESTLKALAATATEVQPFKCVPRGDTSYVCSPHSGDSFPSTQKAVYLPKIEIK